VLGFLTLEDFEGVRQHDSVSVVTEFWRMRVLKVPLIFEAIVAIIKVVIEQ
jgi:hypothetical protein